MPQPSVIQGINTIDRETAHQVLDAIHAHLQTGSDLYMIIDAAQDSRIYPTIRAAKRTFSCLYDGWSTPEPLKSVAPYMLKVRKADEFTLWCLMEGFKKSWLLFFAAPEKTLDDMRLHFKRLSFVKSSQGKKMLFRYYDPRVLRTYIPTCTTEERQFIFKDIQSFWIAEERNKLGSTTNEIFDFSTTVEVPAPGSLSEKPETLSGYLLEQHNTDGTRRHLGRNRHHNAKWGEPHA